MDIATLKKKTFQLMDEFSLSGVIQSAGLNQDFIYRFNGLADAAQKEVAQVKKIHAVFSVSQNPIMPQVSDGFKLQQYRVTNAPIIYKATGSQAYYFEVDREAIIHIEEQTALNVWTNLDTINVPSGVGGFTAFKDIITPSILTNDVRIRFDGLYPYNIRNVALYADLFASVADIPNYEPYVRYTLPDTFMELEKVVQETPIRQYIDSGSYRWEGRATFVLPYSYKGSFDIHYFRYPTTITDTSLDTVNLEVDIEAQEAIPYYIAAHLVLTDPTEQSKTTANVLLSEYQSKLGNLRQFNYDGFMMIDNPSGW